MNRDDESNVLFLDLDGVVLDVSERYFRVHSEILFQLGGQTTQKSVYWRLKRQRHKLSTLLSMSGNEHINPHLYLSKWLEMIELWEHLVYDELLPGAREALLSLSQQQLLILVTLRQNREYMLKQLDELGLRRFFGHVLCDSPLVAIPWVTKRNLIDSCGCKSAHAWLAGDSEVDIRAGKALGLTTVGVLSGIRESLTEERPDYCVEDITGLLRIQGDISDKGMSVN